MEGESVTRGFRRIRATLRGIGAGLLPPQMGKIGDFDPTANDLRWLANWIDKLEQERGIGVVKLAKMVRVKHPMISQLKNPDHYEKGPGVELFWRLMAILHEEEEWADVGDRDIRMTLYRVMASIGPSRLHYLSRLSRNEAQAMLDEHEQKSSARRRLESVRTPPEDPEEK